MKRLRELKRDWTDVTRYSRFLPWFVA